MATLNPLEQKARSSFIKGFLLAFLIGIIGTGAFGMLYFQQTGKEKERLDAQKTVMVLNKNVVSGEIITDDMFTTKRCDADIVPVGATDSFSILSSYFAKDVNGNRILTENAKNSDGTTVQVKVIQIASENNKKYELKTDDNGAYYYTNAAKQNITVLLGETTLVAKIDLGTNTVMTPGMITESDEQPSKDLRDEQYNMIVLPSDLADDETVDIRLRLPTGQDYLVLAKKKVKLPLIGGVASSTTVQLKVTEDEILTMSAAIVDAYQITGCKLYAVRYSEPGIQEKAEATYIPARTTLELIDKDPNILKTARDALIDFYNKNNDLYRKGIADAIGQVEENTRQSNIQGSTASESQNQKAERQTYLQSLE